MAPSMIQGATRLSWVRPAMKVCVRHLPKGAGLRSRSPRGERPLSRTRLVFTEVSSMKTKRCGQRRMRGWRRSIQLRRAWRTSARSRSAAIKPFFI
jgi:hypothetical protein